MNAVDLFPTFDNAVLGIVSQPGRMDELHLYHGSRCNRMCAFCCTNGAPEGHHIPFSAEVLQAAVNLVAQKGSLKIYGGEPTLDAANLRWTVGYLRTLGFVGAITVFSNGLRPRVLTSLLDADPGIRVVLNYAILTGSGEKPPPASVLAHLRAYHAANPGRLYLSHEFIVPVGRQRENDADRPDASVVRHGSSSLQRCYRCHPTLTSRGQFHACPFAVEYDRVHFALGRVDEPSSVIQQRFDRFLRWIDERLDPEAARQERHSCAVCTGSDPPAFARPPEEI